MSKHLFPRNTSTSEPFQKPPDGGGAPKTPDRDREEHGKFLLATIEEIARTAANVPVGVGSDAVYLEFEGDPGSPLALGSIESTLDKRELVAVSSRIEDGQEVFTATVLADPDKLDKLAAKVESYLTEDKRDAPDEPKNKALVNSISAIRFAPLQSILVGARVQDAEAINQWEAWLRPGADDEEREAIINGFRGAAEVNRIYVGERTIRFPEASVILVTASFRQINEVIFPLNVLAELRRAAVTAEFFARLPRNEQIDWNADAAGRIQIADGILPSVCLLDTGVNRGHPLIQPSLAERDLHTYDPNWLVTDHDSHGSKMAGLCLHGDLVELLASAGNVQLRHCLESVKIFPLPPQENLHELYGSITIECVARAEIAAPDRRRVICLAVTSLTDRNQGMPSSWSGTIDRLATGSDEEDVTRRLFFISAGNADQNGYSDYPDSNHSDQIHDPAQSWNAITVGAHTEKDLIPADSPDAGLGVLAPYGVLSPHSTTSRTWRNMWPSKPDIVMEGGNLGVGGGGGYFPELSALRLLTTSHEWIQNPLIDFGSTSASTALASRFGAMILAEYPDIWPETIRALLIHSAEWTEEMIAEASGDKSHLLECYGFGVPNIQRALESKRNSLTLVVQDQLQPFKEENGKRRANEMNLHELPWARDILLDLGEVETEMRVTLSYFIEPNPSSKGFSSKHRYASHQLQFATVRSEENSEGFRHRVNKASREDGEPGGGSGDNEGWFLKPRMRTKGSIHSDVWNGTAAQLATKNMIAVYPVGGWWRDLKRKQRWSSIARYSLVVSIKTEAEDVDIYTPIQNQIENVIEIEN